MTDPNKYAFRMLFVLGRELKRDSKSFRSYYIITRIQQGVPHNAIAQNCGTSTAMIDKHYSCYQQLQYL